MNGGKTTTSSADAIGISISVLVIAHPDDESMFFLPTIRACQTQKDSSWDEFWILCLTIGDYDGLGAVRTKELEKVCNTNLLHVDELIQLDDQALLDHPTQSWNVEHAYGCIREALRRKLDEKRKDWGDQSTVHLKVLTFDDEGVSGHINHRDCHYAVCLFDLKIREEVRSGNKKTLKAKLPGVESMEVWTLETIRNPIRKYIPVIEWIRLVAFTLTTLGVAILPLWACARHLNPASLIHGREVMTCRLNDPLLNWRAMAAHHSQFVWYRRLFVIFSCYTYVNVLRRLGSDESRTKEVQ